MQNCRKEGITRRGRYKKESKQLPGDTYSGRHPGRAKVAKKAGKRLKTIAGTQLHEPDKKMSEERKSPCRDVFKLYRRAVNQQK